VQHDAPRDIGTTPVDPYDVPRSPKERKGPVLRYVIVAALLGAGALGYATFSNSDGATNSLTESSEPTTLADASQNMGYSTSPVQDFVEPTAAPTPAPVSRATAPVPAPIENAPEADPLPPPTTTTVPSEPATPLPPS